jgi:hypothetical protein
MAFEAAQRPCRCHTNWVYRGPSVLGRFGEFFLGTGRVPGWSPTPPLASCHRDTHRAVLLQFWGPFWALAGRPGAARDDQNRILTFTKFPIGPISAAATKTLTSVGDSAENDDP